MKKRNLLLGILSAVALGIAGCGANSDSDVTRVEQKRELTEASESMQADDPKDENDNVDDVLIVDGADDDDDDEAAADKATDEAVLNVEEKQVQENEEAATEITEAQAKEIVFQDAGIEEDDVKGIRVEKDFDDGRHQYDIDFYAGNVEYDYEIDVYSGDILSRDYDIENDFAYEQNTQSTDYITREEAVKIVLDRVKGATENQVLIELDEDDGRLIYEGEVHYNNREFEFEMNASNGKILEWSEESAVD